MWYEFERAAEGAARDRARRAVLNAIGYEEGRPPPPRYDEYTHFWFFRGVVPFVIWFAKVCSMICFLLAMSMGSYAMILGLIMRGLDVRSHKIFFDYSPSTRGPLMPMGIIDLRSTKNAPWVNSCAESLNNSSPAEYACINDINEITYRVEGGQDGNDSKNGVLESGKRYFFELSLTLPESDVNKRLGVFMVKVELRSADWSLLALSKQHSLLPFESAYVSLFRKTTMMLPLASGILSEARTVTLHAFDQYKDVNDKKPVSFVEISLGVPKPATFPATVQAIQIQSAELRYGKEMNSIQAFFRNWHYFCAIIGTVALFWGYTLVALSILNHRSERHRWKTQPYANFFDSDEDESGDDARSVSQDRWMGADIEILDDDENDSGAWEPIESIEKKTKNENLDEGKNLVSEDDESVPSKQNKSRERDAITAPLENLGDYNTVSDDPLLAEMPHDKKECKHGYSDEKCRDDVELRMKRAQKKEEQHLADMVMKGWSFFFMMHLKLCVCIVV
ncbi:hypothetical protein ACHAXA_002582 [Cyclostephanos tholiformis]|uniref:Seipin n=1 Tax=Cyclostephanos tholiformis TaxID=382380 RepID=A0ABD3R440_9STRA